MPEGVFKDDGLIVPVEITELAPHPFEAATETLPLPAPIVTVTAVVPCPLIIVQPVPVTDQL